MLKDIHCAELHHQCCITWLTLHYIINAGLLPHNAVLHDPSCIISSTLLYIINAALYRQRCIIWSTLPSMIKAALYDQRCVIWSTLYYMINAALYDQWCITLPMLNSITQCKVVYANYMERLHPTFIWNLLSQFNQKFCYVAGKIAFTINSDVKQSCRTNFVIFFK